MSTAAFFMMRGRDRGLTLLKVDQDEGRFTFRFSDPQGLGRLLHVEFMTSEFREFDSQVRSLKKLCFDGRSCRGSRHRNTGARR